MRLGRDQPDAWNELRELERRDWAVRVLDAHGRSIEASPSQVHPKTISGAELDFHICVPMRVSKGTLFEWSIFYGANEDAARLAAALAVFPTLPADVRAELGEEP